MNDMYLTIKQHDAFRTLLMGFEIPFRKYIADVITSKYDSEDDFDMAMRSKYSLLSPASPELLKTVLTKACSNNTLKDAYRKFQTASTSGEIVSTDTEIPMVGLLNLVTFALTEDFRELYLLFGSYNSFCNSAETYRYARNKLDHPGSRTLEDTHLVSVLSFVKDICMFLDDSCFLQKTKEQLISEVKSLQQRKMNIPVDIHNFADMPYSDSRIVCRNVELETIKKFVYGKPEDLRKQHSCCIYGYGGVGKTALVLETLKQIVGDIQDGVTINDYSPNYILFFSAKKRKLTLASETGRFIEQQIKSHFESADDLKELILSALNIESLKHFKKEGLIVVDNLETLDSTERKKVKSFVETQTPSEMQFILTSRNSEEYELNYKLGGFDSESGKTFIKTYNEENSLELTLSSKEEDVLISLAKGNTLVLVLSMRRLSKNLSSIKALKAEFDFGNAWKSLNNTLVKTPSSAYEVIAEFMFKDTFENIEITFAANKELFYKVLTIFAIIQNESIDISTLCLLINASYPDIETVVDILCSYLILEKNDTQYSINGFAEKYIIGRFLPDAETYERLSKDIVARQAHVSESLDKLKEDIEKRPALGKIINDWFIITDIDRITAAEMYKLYGEVKDDCKRAGRFVVESVLMDFVKKCDESEKLTAHPYIKYQKARILQLIDSSQILPEKHLKEIRKAYNDAIYSIKTIEQYSGIQQTKSYASLLWLYGQFLDGSDDDTITMRYLEESKESFEDQGIIDQEYYQCITLLANVYLNYYDQNRNQRQTYLQKASNINKKLQSNWDKIQKARSFVGQLKVRLRSLGKN